MKMLESEEDIIRIIQEDQEMMKLIETAKLLELPDWWICAGFVRAKIWDILHGYQAKTAIPDIDVIYFDKNRIDEQFEKELEAQLNSLLPGVPWSVKNQARMHVINGLSPYESALEGIAKFPETATALGIKLDRNNNLVLAAPHGIEDVINFKVRPTPLFKQSEKLACIYHKRLQEKNWKARWHKVTAEII